MIRVHLWFQSANTDPLDEESDMFDMMVVAATADAAFKHAEIAIPYAVYHGLGYPPLPPPKNPNLRAEQCEVAFSAGALEGVVLRYRGFEHKCYEMPVGVQMSEAGVRRMIDFMRAHVPGKYDSRVIRSLLYPRAATDRWFCTQIVCAALQVGGLLEGFNPTEMTTGTELHSALMGFAPLVPAGLVAGTFIRVNQLAKK